MSKKRSISQLIRDEVEQQELFAPPKVVLDKPSRATCPEQKHWVETYSPSKRKSHSYYRYVYRQCSTLYHCHLRGGSTTSPSAQALKEKVLDAIADCKTPQEIVKLIKSGSSP